MKIAFLFVGTIIGAGFASGKELISFFGNYSAYIIPIAIGVGLLFFYTAWLFLSMGKLLKPNSLADITKAMYGKGAIVMDIFIIISYFIVMSAMLAGIESLMKEGLNISLPIPLFSIITLVISLVIVLKGIGGLIKANSILVPIIVIFTLGVSVSGFFVGTPDITARIVQPVSGNVIGMIANVLLYVCMNMLLTAAVLGASGKGLSKKGILVGSGVGSAIIMTAIIMILTAIFMSVPQIMESDLPLLFIASRFGGLVAFIAVVIIWCGVFTTLISSVYPILEWSDGFLKKRWISVPLIAVIGLAISLLGFSGIVDLLYPVMGAIGLFFIISASVYYFKNSGKIYEKDE